MEVWPDRVRQRASVDGVHVKSKHGLSVPQIRRITKALIGEMSDGDKLRLVDKAIKRGMLDYPLG